MIEGVIMILTSTVVVVSGTEGSVRFSLSTFLLSERVGGLGHSDLQVSIAQDYLSIVIVSGLFSQNKY